MTLPQEKEKYIDWLEGLQVTEEEAEGANRERQLLLSDLYRKNVKIGGNGKKIYSGDLSPGCVSCMRGSWSCVFLTKQCTASCFFCPQKAEDGLVPHANRNDFPNLAAFVPLTDYNMEESNEIGVDEMAAKPVRERTFQWAMFLWVGAIVFQGGWRAEWT